MSVEIQAKIVCDGCKPENPLTELETGRILKAVDQLGN
jgi:hypothetical protein